MKNKAKIRYIRLIGLVFVVFMIFGIAREIYQTIRINHQINQAKQENKELLEEAIRLENEIKRLEDENFIQTYVSGTIFATGGGTTIYVLPREDETPE